MVVEKKFEKIQRILMMIMGNLGSGTAHRVAACQREAAAVVLLRKAAIRMLLKATHGKLSDHDHQAGRFDCCFEPRNLYANMHCCYWIDWFFRGRDSDDSEEQRERRALRKQIREKEVAYAERLRKWEARERRQAKLYDRDEQREKQRKRDMQKEAKKLKHFLEDYDDERMDQKYYKSSSLFQRRRDFEREREADAKDRQREQQEIEELKTQILAENSTIENVEEEARKRHEEQEEALLRKIRADSGSPNPHRPLGQKPLPPEPEKDEESEESESDSESEGTVEEPIKAEKPVEKQSSWKAVSSEGVSAVNSPGVASPSLMSSSVASPAVVRTDVIAPARPSTSSHLNGVFGFEENDEDIAFRKKKLKPFEITDEDRIQAMTPEERKQMIKDLIDRIPTVKDELFAFPINWNYVDKLLVEQRVIMNPF
ncbi:unnamed protein product [Gongylonema pulchrum]|uniref:PWI domain-containing protein n=1 Tax=Gongylonema pulchrum TaxID=637853 RepID=A0A183EV62_9BILA|nr:unnamed protein product [Gongylonema pulchrum]